MSASDVATAPVHEAATAEAPARLAGLASAGCIAAAFGLWIWSLPLIAPDRLDDLGLVSILPVSYWAGLALLCAGFTLSLGPALRWPLLAPAALGVLILMLHATPAIAYGTLRYSWAWKHIGIIDFIQRHGGMDPTAPFLAAYHNWPGFFWVMAWIADLFGLNALEIADLARFFSVFASLIFVILLHAIYRRFTDDTRLIWAALWMFVCGNWVGQDYFSPQATAFALHLFVIALCLGPLMPSGGAGQTGFAGMLWEVRALFARGAPRPPVATPATRIFATMAVFIAIGAIVATHQLTPIILLFSLLALSAITPLSLAYPALAGLALAFWVIYPAAPFTAAYLPAEIAALGQPVDNLGGKMVDAGTLTSQAAIVVWAGRALTVGVVLLAVFGWLRRLRVGGRDGVAGALLAAPIPILAVTSYGGEAVFRIYFFCIPFLAFFAAALFFASNVAARNVASRIVVASVALLMAVGFLFGNNGKDRQYRFSPDEVAAAAWLYANAAPGTLLVEGARSYPSQFMNYENFSYVPLANERPDSQAEILADPAHVLGRWVTDPRWRDGYVILTRSQNAYVEALGVMPAGSLARIEDAIAASPDFRLVFANRDARIYQGTHFADLRAAAAD